MPELTHVDADGDARMVDVSDKAATARLAVATGRIQMGPEAVAAVRERRVKKGDVLTIAQIAGIQGAKRAADWIPLCHPIALTGAKITFEVDDHGVTCTATVKTTGPTGVEMEALTAVTAALLTVYDMLKAVDRAMRIEGVRLLRKEGGRSGVYAAE